MFIMAIVALIGLLFIYLAFKKIGTNRKLSKEGIVTEGMVSGFETKEREDDDGNISYMYTPVIKFISDKAKEFEFESSSSYSHPSMKVGDPMSVIYLSSTPDDAQINTASNKWVPVIVLFVLGILLAFVGITSVIFSEV